MGGLEEGKRVKRQYMYYNWLPCIQNPNIIPVIFSLLKPPITSKKVFCFKNCSNLSLFQESVQLNTKFLITKTFFLTFVQNDFWNKIKSVQIYYLPAKNCFFVTYHSWSLHHLPQQNWLLDPGDLEYFFYFGQNFRLNVKNF